MSGASRTWLLIRYPLTVRRKLDHHLKISQYFRLAHTCNPCPSLNPQLLSAQRVTPISLNQSPRCIPHSCTTALANLAPHRQISLPALKGIRCATTPRTLDTPRCFYPPSSTSQKYYHANFGNGKVGGSEGGFRVRGV